MVVDCDVIVINSGELIIAGATLTMLLEFDEEHDIDISGFKVCTSKQRHYQQGNRYWLEVYEMDDFNPELPASGTDF